jgi:predicted ATP-dependent protease
MDEARHSLELGPELLRKVTDPASLGFETTRDLPAPRLMAGQRLAQEAIDFALEMSDSRYNLYVAGPAGTGRRLAVMRTVERVARSRAPALDWCFVANFDQQDEPRALALPAGMGKAFAQDVSAVVQSARRELRRAFSTDDYMRKRREIVRDLSDRREQIFDQVREQTLALGFAIRETEKGLAITPVTRAAPRRASGNSISNLMGGQTPPAAPSDEVGSDDAGELVPLTPEMINQLSPEERQRLDENEGRVEDLLEQQLIPQIRQAEEAAQLRLRVLNREVADKALSTLGDDTIARYAGSADAVEFLRRLRADIAAHGRALRGDPSASAAREEAGASEEEDDGDTGEREPDDVTTEDAEAAAADALEDGESEEEDRELRLFLRRYKVNVLSAHRADDHAPIVEEVNPTRANLMGRIEVGILGGMPYTDHLMIKPGALHRANGGYLIIHARDLIGSPGAWEAIKRTLRFGTITLDINADGSEGPRSATLRPEPVQANLRVILIGSRKVYAGLAELDPEFRELFKVRADFDTQMTRTPEHEAAYAHFAGDVARATGGPPLTAEAVSLLIMEGSRWADNQEKLSALFGDVRDLTSEACYWARKEQAPTTTGTHMQRAIQQRMRRVSLGAERELYELRENGQILIDTDGEVVGQINGLSVAHTVDMAYGAPTRITARTAPGLAGIINIEREIDLSGPIYDKGVFVLAGYLNGKFAQQAPLGLTASLCFEQEYDGVDGDSASSAEVYALLSSLSGVPIKQSLAVTGSVNQRGEVQAIGGVNEKIEGFFRMCRTRGLTGRQGVLMPRTNMRNVVLRDDVVAAVRAGQFHIFAVSTIDEGIELLTGLPAGHLGADGNYLAGTINARVTQTLQAFNERVRAFGLAPAYAARPVR